MTKNKLHLGVALATLTMATALVSPQAAAKHKVAKHKSVATYAAPSKTDLMEAQLRSMQDEIASLRAQVNSTAPVTAVDAQKVQELDARMATVETTSTKLIQKEKRKDNMVFFRGGYQYYEKQRQGGTLPLVNGTNTLSGNDAWYVGAGFDFSLLMICGALCTAPKCWQNSCLIINKLAPRLLTVLALKVLALNLN
jgi:hypothetical protein